MCCCSSSRRTRMVERRRMFEELISKARALGASDVHLEAETPIVARIRGELQIVGGTLSAERLAQASQALLGAEGWALFGTRGSADMSVAIGGARRRARDPLARTLSQGSARL